MFPSGAERTNFLPPKITGGFFSTSLTKKLTLHQSFSYTHLQRQNPLNTCTRQPRASLGFFPLQVLFDTLEVPPHRFAIVLAMTNMVVPECAAKFPLQNMSSPLAPTKANKTDNASIEFQQPRTLGLYKKHVSRSFSTQAMT